MRYQSGFGSAGPRLILVITSAGAYSAAPIRAPRPAPTPERSTSSLGRPRPRSAGAAARGTGSGLGQTLGFAGWAGVDSNHRPTDYESAALTPELPALERNLALPYLDGPRIVDEVPYRPHPTTFLSAFFPHHSASRRAVARSSNAGGRGATEPFDDRVSAEASGKKGMLRPRVQAGVSVERPRTVETDERPKRVDPLAAARRRSSRSTAGACASPVPSGPSFRGGSRPVPGCSDRCAGGVWTNTAARREAPRRGGGACLGSGGSPRSVAPRGRRPLVAVLAQSEEHENHKRHHGGHTKPPPQCPANHEIRDRTGKSNQPRRNPRGRTM
jgi:hypothetical protein